MITFLIKKAEINNIVSDPTSAKRIKNKDMPKIPPIDYMTDNQSLSDTTISNNSQTIICNTPTQIPSNKSEKSPKPVSIDKPSVAQINQKISKEIKQTENENEILRLNGLKDQYKRAALIAKKSGDQSLALSHIRTAKV
jgi:hypothetical protein